MARNQMEGERFRFCKANYRGKALQEGMELYNFSFLCGIPLFFSMPKFKSILKHGVLTVRVKPVSGEKINDRELEYISGKQIRGLLHVQQVRKLFFKGVEYTGPAGISLNTYLEKTYSKREFLFLIGTNC